MKTKSKVGGFRKHTRGASSSSSHPKNEEVAVVKRTCRISDDVLEYYILPRLPAKTLVRLGCVSKRWSALITEPDYHFLNRHSRYISSSSAFLQVQGPQDALLPFLVTPDSNLVNIPPLPTHPAGKKVYHQMIVASCHGLICLWIGRPCFKICIGNPVLAVWDDLIDQIPESVNQELYRVGANPFFGLAVDVSMSEVSYNLVLLIFDREKRNYGFSNYSSKTCIWEASKERILLLRGDLRIQSRVSAYVRETLYWNMGAGYAIWFNPTEDQSGLLRLPMSSQRHVSNTYLGMVGEWNEKLTYMTVTEKEIRMWALGDNDYWSKWHRLNLMDVLGSKITVQVQACDFCLMPYDGRGVLVYFLDGFMYCYDLKKGAVTEFSFGMEAPGVGRQRTVSANASHSWFPYKNSIVPVPNVIPLGL